MSSPAGQPERPGTPTQMPIEVSQQKTYAFIYATGPQWAALSRSRTSKRIAPIWGELYARGRVLLGGPFLDDAEGGVASVRAKGRPEATALLAADPAIREGVFTGVVRRCHALFNEAEDLRTALSRASANKRTVKALFEAVHRRDGEGVRAGYDENITIHEAGSLPYGGDYHGREGALRHGQGFRAAWDRLQPHEARGLNPQIIAAGDHV